jgi:hypothetical protein
MLQPRSTRRCYCRRLPGSDSCPEGDCIERLPAITNLLPIEVAPFQLVTKKIFGRVYEAKRGIVDLHVTYKFGEANLLIFAGSEIVSLAVSDDLLNVHMRRKLIEWDVTRIDNTGTIPM